MEWVETTGNTVKDAIDRALERLGVAEIDAEVVVLEEPKSSMFGLRRTDARIRARVRPVQARAKRPSRRSSSAEGRKRQGDRRQGSGAAVATEGSSDVAAQTRSRARGNGSGEGEDARQGTSSGSRGRRRTSSGGRGGSGRTVASSSATASGEDAESGSAGSRSAEHQTDSIGSTPAGGDRQGSGRSRSGSRSRQRSAGGSNRQRENVTPTGTKDTEEEEMSTEVQAEMAVEFVRGVVDRFGLEGSTSSELLDEDTVRVSVDGDNLGLLIGPRGSTVDALQELTRTAVQRRGDESRVRIVVDVGGYRVRRAAALQQFARRVADEVRESGEPQALDVMSASDRKVVHDVINDLDGVRTTSEGEEPRRYVVVHPSSKPAAVAEEVIEADDADVDAEDFGAEG